MKKTEKEWLEGFKEFVSSEGDPVPEELSKKILQYVHADLNPSAWLVFAKLLGIHFFGGTLSLAICSQFSINPFHTEFSLSEYFMKFGHSTCMVLCGVIFIGLTILLGYIALRQEEFLVLSRNSALQVFGLSVLSMAAFIGFGAEVVLSIAALWLLGAMAGGVVTVKVLVRNLSPIQPQNGAEF